MCNGIVSSIWKLPNTPFNLNLILQNNDYCFIIDISLHYPTFADVHRVAVFGGRYTQQNIGLEIQRQVLAISRRRIGYNVTLLPNDLDIWITKIESFNFKGCEFVVLCPCSDWLGNIHDESCVMDASSDYVTTYKQLWMAAIRRAGSATVVAMEMPPRVRQEGITGD